MLNSDAAWSASRNTNEVVKWIGVARAPVVGSGAAPACSDSVSKPGYLGPLIVIVSMVCSIGPAIIVASKCAAGCRFAMRAHRWIFQSAWATFEARKTTQPPRALPMKVSEILKVKGNILYTVTPDTPMAEAVNTMAEKDIGSLVVMEFGELVGMLTFREVMKTLHLNKGQIGRETVRKH